MHYSTWTILDGEFIISPNLMIDLRFFIKRNQQEQIYEIR